MPDKFAKGGKHIYAKGTAIAEKIQAHEVLNELIKGYFGQDIYVSEGLGFKSPQEFINEKGMKPEYAIDAAIEHNRMRILNEKNFLFTGDQDLRKLAVKVYDAIAKGTYNPVELATMQTVIRIKRRDAEIKERVQLMMALDPALDKRFAEQEAQYRVGEGQCLDLKQEVKMAQQGQLARSINAKALELVLGGDADKYSSKIRIYKIGKYILEGLLELDATVLAKPISADALKDYLPALPKEQRKPYMDAIYHQAEQIRQDFARVKAILATNATNTAELEQQVFQSLLKTEAIDLEAFKANYAGHADKNSSKEQAEQVLDQIRAGLIMHVVTDSTFAVTTSIKTVLSTQQAILSNNDELNDVILICQLHGRATRDKEGAALYQQVMAEGVQSFFKLSDVLVLNANLSAAS